MWDLGRVTESACAFVLHLSEEGNNASLPQSGGCEVQYINSLRVLRYYGVEYTDQQAYFSKDLCSKLLPFNHLNLTG
uniref:Uncharacterized protein n=1 Tax=Pelusios castaneus TaxID=367368 RepID=A0A8C8VFB0_9SAUR